MAELLLEVDGVSLRTEAYNVTTQTGRFSMPSTRGEDVYLAGKSGYTYVPNKPYDAGLGAFAVWVVGKDPTTGAIAATHTLRQNQMRTNLAVLQRLFARKHRLITIRAGQPDSSVRTCQAQFIEWSEPEIQAGGTRAEFSVGFTIPAVWWEDDGAATLQSSTTGATLPKTLSLTSFANMTGVIEDALVEVVGPITNPRVTVSETGDYVELLQSVPNGQSWLLDAKAYTSIVNAASVMTNTRHAGGYGLLSVPNIFGSTFTPQLVLSGTAGGTNTQLKFTARKKFTNG